MDGKEKGLMLRNMKLKPLSAWNSIRLLSSIRSANKSYRKSAPHKLCRMPELGGPLQPPCVLSRFLRNCHDTSTSPQILTAEHTVNYNTPGGEA
jgi:hypothetical protein